MSIIRITKEFSFEGAHALKGYDGKCRHIHGHSYRLFVTYIGRTSEKWDHPKSGMVIDFTEIKKMVNELIIGPFDHALILREDAPLGEEIREAYCNVRIVNFQPTCENLVAHFASILSENEPAGLKLFSLKLHETATSFVEWYASDNNTHER
jgi:6-pyruvoyltetrahydropterin/6-carboxytetrahydropterin synthase